MAPRKMTTPEGDAILAAETATPPKNDPPPKDVPPKTDKDDAADPPPAGDAPRRRGRPAGSKNTTRRGRGTRLDEIEASARVAWERVTQLAGFSIFANPALPPARKVVWLNDMEILRSEDGVDAVVGALRLACERNSKIEAAALRMIAASAYTGIGATFVFGLALPIMTNHGVIPPAIANMLGVQMPENRIVVQHPTETPPPPPPTRPAPRPPVDDDNPPPLPMQPTVVREQHPADAPAYVPPLEVPPTDDEQALVFGRTEIHPEMFG